MIKLNENQVKKLKVGDKVAYKERSGDLSPFLYKAKVVGKYKYFVLLRCAATKNPLLSYEEAERYFNTCFAYKDCCEYSGYSLYDYDSAFDDFYEFGM